MTIIDFEDGLELLREHDIRVVRARVVESADDAVSFAARRTIDLRILAPSDVDERTIEPGLRASDKIRGAYARLHERVLAHPGSRILARRILEVGNDVAIEGRDDADLGRIVEIRSGDRAAHRLHPLGEQRAEAMLAELHAKLGVASSGARTRMLAHLLLHVSSVFDDEAIERVVLDQVRVADNSYEVADAHVFAKGPLAFERRRGGPARERDGYYAPASRN